MRTTNFFKFSKTHVVVEKCRHATGNFFRRAARHVHQRETSAKCVHVVSDDVPNVIGTKSEERFDTRSQVSATKSEGKPIDTRSHVSGTKTEEKGMFLTQ